MKKVFLIAFAAMLCQQLMAIKTMPIQGEVIKPTDAHIQYAGRISSSRRVVILWLRLIRPSLSRWLFEAIATRW